MSTTPNPSALVEGQRVTTAKDMESSADVEGNDDE